MKGYFFLFSIVLISFISCVRQKKEEKKDPEAIEIKDSDVSTSDTIKRCHTMQVLEKHLVRYPELRSNMERIEKRCQEFAELRKQGKIEALDTISIPVIVHVLYNQENENISDAQIQSQITVLNQDFTKTNPDTDQIPEEFADLASNSKIHFELDSIIRVKTSVATWGTDDQMKFTSNGGSNVVSPATKLNVWVCTIGGGILGYAQFPGDAPETDGVVIAPQYFGTEGTAQAPFDKGRTTTHEIGHWLNLRHIWGDGDCTRDDMVQDTPVSDQPNYGCPRYPTLRCESNDMTMNYMDYTDDGCMHMFSEGQVNRMRAVFTEGGGRESFTKNLK